MSFREHKWIIEYTSPVTAHMFAISNFVASKKTEYQQVEIADTPKYGRILLLDGKIQSAEFDEYIYHEALVHPAMLMFGEPKSVLVIGGGEGATLREVFRHQSVEKLVMVDLDREVVQLCTEYMEKWHQGSFLDKRLTMHFMDAREYLEKNTDKFDIIISDVPEPVENGPALKLFTKQYFSLATEHLNKNGYLVFQAGDFNLSFVEAHGLMLNTVRQVLPFALSYHTPVPSFNTDWSFIIASAENHQLANVDHFDKIIEKNQLSLNFIDGQTIEGMFRVQKNIREIFKREKRVIDDDNLLTIY